MKKILIILSVLFLITGCLSTSNVKSKGISMEFNEENSSNSNVDVGKLELYVK
jgi:uncharacterized lipoprotein YajG